jgi:hypothetical protein
VGNFLTRPLKFTIKLANGHAHSEGILEEVLELNAIWLDESISNVPLAVRAWLPGLAAQKPRFTTQPDLIKRS